MEDLSKLCKNFMDYFYENHEQLKNETKL